MPSTARAVFDLLDALVRPRNAQVMSSNPISGSDLGGSSQPPAVYLNPPGHGAPPPLGPSSHQGPMRWTTQESQLSLIHI